MKNKEKEKVFLVFNTAFIGDILVTNSLVRNIKHYYPKSKVIFVCNKKFTDVAKFQEGVDEVIPFDKINNNTPAGILNFVKHFPYKKPFASFVTYANDRNLLISRLLGAKHIISHHKCKIWNTREKYLMPEYVHMKEKWAGMIEVLCGEHQNLPIKYNLPEVNSNILKKVVSLTNPVVLSPTSNFYRKDMPTEDCILLIDLMKQNGLTPVLTGAGTVAREYAVSLKQHGCFDFTDLTDCTSFIELAAVLKACNQCITVDTGTLHFANALSVPVVSVFYAGCEEMWAPDTNLYPAITLTQNTTPQDIINAFSKLRGGKF